MNWKPYFIWKNTDSRQMGIETLRLPVITRSEERVSFIEVPGRSGLLHISEEAYNQLDLNVEIAFLNLNRINQIFDWLRGSGEVIFSNQRNMKYRAYISNKISLEQVIYQIHKAEVRFSCQPFKYAVDNLNDKLEIMKNGDIFLGKGMVNAQPIITVYCSGNATLNINSQQIQLFGISGYIAINSEIMDAYKDGENQNMKMSGEFPVLRANGEVNTISWTGSVSKVEIIPNWRWL